MPIGMVRFHDRRVMSRTHKVRRNSCPRLGSIQVQKIKQSQPSESLRVVNKSLDKVLARINRMIAQCDSALEGSSRGSGSVLSERKVQNLIHSPENEEETWDQIMDALLAQLAKCNSVFSKEEV